MHLSPILPSPGYRPLPAPTFRPADGKSCLAACDRSLVAIDKLSLAGSGGSRTVPVRGHGKDQQRRRRREANWREDEGIIRHSGVRNWLPERLNARSQATMHRVVITGMGAITPLGLDAASTWEGIGAG